jgi:hypothetical protein
MSEIPTLEATPQAHVHLIGGEKGGVGKSLVSRLLAQYFIDHDIPFLGFDTDRSHGSLMRFYAGYASPVLVDRYEALDTIIESSIDQPGRRVLVDLAAQTHDPLARGWTSPACSTWPTSPAWPSTTGTSWTGRDSVDLLKKLLDRFGHRLHYVLVRNQLRGDDFTQLEQSGEMERALGLGAKVVNIRRLHDAVVQKIDAANSSFWAAKNAANGNGAKLGLMERQRLKLWLNHAYAEIGAAGV